MIARGGLQIAEKRREAKGKGENERHTHPNAEFQKITRRNKKAFFSDQCKEIKEKNRMGKTRDVFKKIRDTKGTFHAKMGSIKDRNVPLVSLIFLKRSLVFPILLFSSISLHWSLKKTFLSLLGILLNSAFKWVYLSFSPLPLASLLFSAICKPPQPFCLFAFLGHCLLYNVMNLIP